MTNLEIGIGCALAIYCCCSFLSIHKHYLKCAKLAQEYSPPGIHEHLLVELVYYDGSRLKLSPLTYEQFEKEDDYLGSSDTAYDTYLREHKEHSLSSFDFEFVGGDYWIEVDGKRYG